MRKLKFSIFIALSILLISMYSCKGKKEQPQGPQPTKFELGMTNEDSMAVKTLVDHFFKYAMKKDFTSAAGMIYRNDKTGNGLAELLDNKEMQKVKAMLESIPIVDYKIEYIKFNEYDANEVLCNVVMYEAHDDVPAATTKIFFKPVHSVDGWVLCLMNTEYGDKGVVRPNRRDSVEKDYAHKDSLKAAAKNNQKK